MLQTISFFSIYNHYMTSNMYTALVPNQRIVTLHDLKTMNVPASITPSICFVKKTMAHSCIQERNYFHAFYGGENFLILVLPPHILQIFN